MSIPGDIDPPKKLLLQSIKSIVIQVPTSITTLFDFGYSNDAAAASASLQEVADTIRAATGAGVAVDLEATARGLGYDSFADAVDAYNREHGTNYTPEEARDALQ